MQVTKPTHISPPCVTQVQKRADSFHCVGGIQIQCVDVDDEQLLAPNNRQPPAVRDVMRLKKGGSASNRKCVAPLDNLFVVALSSLQLPIKIILPVTIQRKQSPTRRSDAMRHNSWHFLT